MASLTASPPNVAELMCQYSIWTGWAKATPMLHAERNATANRLTSRRKGLESMAGNASLRSLTGCWWELLSTECHKALIPKTDLGCFGPSHPSRWQTRSKPLAHDAQGLLRIFRLRKWDRRIFQPAFHGPRIHADNGYAVLEGQAELGQRAQFPANSHDHVSGQHHQNVSGLAHASRKDNVNERVGGFLMNPRKQPDGACPPALGTTGSCFHDTS